MIAKLALLLKAFKIFGLLKTEAKIVLISMSVMLLLPFFAAIALVNAPLQAVSDALAWLNPVSHKVEYRDPEGIIRELDVTTVWPVRGNATQEFGVPNLPYEVSHSGIDIGAPIGEPVTPLMPGTVIRAGPLTVGCGLCVHIDHGHGIISGYSHLSKVLVTEGQDVKPGDAIGEIGETGWAHGTHLHFTIRVSGLLVNPRVFLINEPVPIGG